jgi:hypothetical protein
VKGNTLKRDVDDWLSQEGSVLIISYGIFANAVLGDKKAPAPSGGGAAAAAAAAGPGDDDDEDVEEGEQAEEVGGNIGGQPSKLERVNTGVGAMQQRRSGLSSQ